MNEITKSSMNSLLQLACLKHSLVTRKWATSWFLDPKSVLHPRQNEDFSVGGCKRVDWHYLQLPRQETSFDAEGAVVEIVSPMYRTAWLSSQARLIARSPGFQQVPMCVCRRRSPPIWLNIPYFLLPDGPLSFYSLHFPFRLSVSFNRQRSHLGDIIPVFLVVNDADNVTDPRPSCQDNFVCQRGDFAIDSERCRCRTELTAACFRRLITQTESFEFEQDQIADLKFLSVRMESTYLFRASWVSMIVDLASSRLLFKSFIRSSIDVTLLSGVLNISGMLRGGIK